jgi:hypothetical protein
LFFFKFRSTKVAKATKQNKTNFLTNTKKQIVNNNDVGKYNIEGKEKKGGAKVPLLSKLGDGTHLCPKATKEKKKAQAPPLLKPGNGTIGTQKHKNIKTRNKKEGAQAPPMLKLSDGVHLHQNQQNKKRKEGEPKFPISSIFGDHA